MTDKKEEEEEEEMKLPDSSKAAKISRSALQAIGGAVPFAGGVLAAIAGAWSEGEQDKINRFLNTGYVCYKTNSKKNKIP